MSRIDFPSGSMVLYDQRFQKRGAHCEQSDDHSPAGCGFDLLRCQLCHRQNQPCFLSDLRACPVRSSAEDAEHFVSGVEEPVGNRQIGVEFYPRLCYNCPNAGFVYR